MPERERPRPDLPDSDYRDRASTLHNKADQARFPEARRTLEEVARCYEILADHVERRRKRTPR